MSLSDDDTKSPTDKDRARTNQEPQKSPKRSSFLSSKEKDKKIMGQEMSNDGNFLKSLTRLLLETSHSSDSPMNNVQEPMKSKYDSFWENPNYFESQNLLMNPSGSVDSDPIQIKQETSLCGDQTSPTKKNQEPGESPQDSSFLSSEETEKKSMSQEINSDEETLQSLRRSFWDSDNNTGNLLNPIDDILGENMASQIDPDLLRYQRSPLKSIKPMKNAERDKEEIKMIPTPGYFNQCTIKKVLNKDDVNATKGRLRLPKSLFEKYIQKHLPDAKFKELTSNNDGIDVVVYDHDKNTTHEMRLTIRGNFFHLMGSWGTEFVIGKNLREEQEIGLVYDSFDSMLHFSVLNS